MPARTRVARDAPHANQSVRPSVGRTDDRPAHPVGGTCLNRKGQACSRSPGSEASPRHFSQTPAHPVWAGNGPASPTTSSPVGKRRGGSQRTRSERRPTPLQLPTPNRSERSGVSAQPPANPNKRSRPQGPSPPLPDRAGETATDSPRPQPATARSPPSRRSGRRLRGWGGSRRCSQGCGCRSPVAGPPDSRPRPGPRTAGVAPAGSRGRACPG